MNTYEITVEVSNGDWHSTRMFGTFHEAAAYGLDFATLKDGKLISIQRMPVGTPAPAFREPVR
jgi:hypothetical protein